MIHEIAIGVSAPPSPIPTRKMLFAVPRCSGLIQSAISLLELGNAAASPTPNANLTKAKDQAIPTQLTQGMSAANAVATVKNDHHTIAIVMIFLGPKRSPIHPAGTWQSAYPTLNALNIHPMASVLN